MIQIDVIGVKYDMLVDCELVEELFVVKIQVVSVVVVQVKVIIEVEKVVVVQVKFDVQVVKEVVWVQVVVQKEVDCQECEVVCEVVNLFWIKMVMLVMCVVSFLIGCQVVNEIGKQVFGMILCGCLLLVLGGLVGMVLCGVLGGLFWCQVVDDVKE